MTQNERAVADVLEAYNAALNAAITQLHERLLISGFGFKDQVRFARCR
jgi:hypothetical protein